MLATRLRKIRWKSFAHGAVIPPLHRHCVQIAAIKIVAPAMAGRVLDRAIQAHGAAGVSQDFPLAHFWVRVLLICLSCWHHLICARYVQAWARVLRLADGPDEVHIAALGASELKRNQ